MWRLAISLCLSIWCAVWAVAQDDTRRIALLVANAAYDEAVGPLQNPENDVAALKASLIRAGFAEGDIRVLLNTSRIQFHRQVRDFAEEAKTLSEGGLAFFYYSGHGAKEPGRESTRLIPVDITDVSDTGFWFDTLDLSDDVIRVFTDAKSKAAWIVAIDACRNELRLPNRQLGGGEDKGFSAVPSSAGMLISFAADSGQTAKDTVGGSALSPYAEALAEELTVPGRTLASIFERVRPRVIGATNGAQAPVYTNKLNVGGLTLISAAPIRSEEDVTWEFVQRIGTQGAFQAYVDQYGARGKYIQIAERQLAGVAAEAAVDPGDAPPYQDISLIWKQFTEAEWSQARSSVILATVLSEVDLETLRTAADAGDADAATLVGWVFGDGFGGVEIDKEVSARYFRQGCDDGQLLACVGFSSNLASGNGVETDFELAAQMAEKACNGGNSRGCFLLGRHFEFGQGRPTNLALAFEYVERACEQAIGEACYRLGYYYSKGTGVEKDDTLAQSYMKLSCDYAYYGGCAGYGISLIEGWGGSFDVEAGVGFLQMACDDGFEWSCGKVAEFE